MRIKTNINLEITRWSNTTFSKLTFKNCMVDSKENYKFDLGVKGLSKGHENHFGF